MPAAPSPRIIYDALLITSHHDFYKPAVAPRVVGLGLGAALIGELVISGHLVVRPHAGANLVTAEQRAAAPPDSLSLWLVEQVRGEPDDLTVPEWLEFLAISDIYPRTADHMVVAGLMIREETKTRFGRKKTAYDADPFIAQAPFARLRRHLSAMDRRMPLPDAFLVGLTESVGLGKSLYSQMPSGARDYAERHLRVLPKQLQALRGHLTAAVADTAYTGTL